MGSITRSFANNITTSGVLLPASLVNNSIANVTAYNASVATGGMKLISSQTASNSASISFTTGIDSTYKEYQFYLINISAKTNNAIFTFQSSTNGGSTYGVTVTSTAFMAYHDQNDTYADIGYDGGEDSAQSTSFIRLFSSASSTVARSNSGSFSLFNPSSTTYVKHWISRISRASSAPEANDNLHAGYFNSTSALNAIQFKMNTGNFDGDILMFGIV
jgi:hypothetical protein